MSEFPHSNLVRSGIRSEKGAGPNTVGDIYLVPLLQAVCLVTVK